MNQQIVIETHQIQQILIDQLKAHPITQSMYMAAGANVTLTIAAYGASKTTLIHIEIDDSGYLIKGRCFPLVRQTDAIQDLGIMVCATDVQAAVQAVIELSDPNSYRQRRLDHNPEHR